MLEVYRILKRNNEHIFKIKIISRFFMCFFSFLHPRTKNLSTSVTLSTQINLLCDQACPKQTHYIKQTWLDIRKMIIGHRS